METTSKLCVKKSFATALLLVVLVSCATKAGIPTWDFARDGSNECARVGPIWVLVAPPPDVPLSCVLEGTVRFGPGPIVVRQIEINLSAIELLGLFSETLSREPQQDSARLPETARSFQPRQEQEKRPQSRWTIAEIKEGQLMTDWQPIIGKTTGVLFWKKTYETEVRHLITVKGSFEIPYRSGFSITTEVRERPSANYKWSDADPELGRASLTEIKDYLLRAIRARLPQRNP